MSHGCWTCLLTENIKTSWTNKGPKLSTIRTQRSYDFLKILLIAPCCCWRVTEWSLPEPENLGWNKMMCFCSCEVFFPKKTSYVIYVVVCREQVINHNINKIAVTWIHRDYIFRIQKESEVITIPNPNHYLIYLTKPRGVSFEKAVKTRAWMLFEGDRFWFPCFTWCFTLIRRSTTFMGILKWNLLKKRTPTKK